MLSMSQSVASSAIKIAPIKGKTFGAFITGVNLSSLTVEERTIIESAFDEYALLVFPGQFLSNAAQLDFARIFGDKFEYESSTFGNHIQTKKSLRTLDLESLRNKVLEKGSPLEFFGKIQLGTQFWHSDSTYTPVQAKAGLLSAKVVPSSGGGTGFADMRAAYEALDESMKNRLADLRAYHSNLYSDAKDVKCFPEVQEEHKLYHPRSFLRPLVKVHPKTGRRSLQIGRHAFGVPGMSSEESAKFLKSLVDFACQGDRVYEHKYEVGDVLIWDNRCLLHQSRPYDYSEPRAMNGTRISGDPSTEGALETPDQGRAILAEEMKCIRLACGLTATPTRSAL